MLHFLFYFFNCQARCHNLQHCRIVIILKVLGSWYDTAQCYTIAQSGHSLAFVFAFHTDANLTSVCHQVLVQDWLLIYLQCLFFFVFFFVLFFFMHWSFFSVSPCHEVSGGVHFAPGNGSNDSFSCRKHPLYLFILSLNINISQWQSWSHATALHVQTVQHKSVQEAKRRLTKASFAMSPKKIPEIQDKKFLDLFVFLFLLLLFFKKTSQSASIIDTGKVCACKIFIQQIKWHSCGWWLGSCRNIKASS